MYCCLFSWVTVKSSCAQQIGCSGFEPKRSCFRLQTRKQCCVCCRHCRYSPHISGSFAVWSTILSLAFSHFFFTYTVVVQLDFLLLLVLYCSSDLFFKMVCVMRSSHQNLINIGQNAVFSTNTLKSRGHKTRNLINRKIQYPLVNVYCIPRLWFIAYYNVIWLFPKALAYITVSLTKIYWEFHSPTATALMILHCETAHNLTLRKTDSFMCPNSIKIQFVGGQVVRYPRLWQAAL